MFVQNIKKAEESLDRNYILVLDNCDYDFEKSKIVCDEKQKTSLQIRLNWGLVKYIDLLTSKQLKNRRQLGAELSGKLQASSKYDTSVQKATKRAHNLQIIRKNMRHTLPRLDFCKFYNYLLPDNCGSSYGNRWVTYRLSNYDHESCQISYSFNRMDTILNLTWLGDLSINFGKKIFVLQSYTPTPITYIGTLKSLKISLINFFANNVATLYDFTDSMYFNLTEISGFIPYALPNKTQLLKLLKAKNYASPQIEPLNFITYRANPLFTWAVFKIVLDYAFRRIYDWEKQGNHRSNFAKLY